VSRHAAPLRARVEELHAQLQKRGEFARAQGALILAESPRPVEDGIKSVFKIVEVESIGPT
jgi:hypothetical protein